MKLADVKAGDVVTADAGFTCIPRSPDGTVVGVIDWADRIAAACVSNGMGDGDTMRLIAEAVRSERETCAAIVDGWAALMRVAGSEPHHVHNVLNAADLIRHQ